MNLSTKVVAVPGTRPKGRARFATVQQFLDEYERGGKLAIDLDPRIDFTKPVYEQVIALQLKDQKDAETVTRRRAIAE
jgi:hypothetical protein